MRVNRQGLIVWFQHRKNLKKIKRYGNLIYASKRMRYAILYVDQAGIDGTAERLLSYPFVSKVEYSERPFIRTEYEGKNTENYKAELYDYGI